MPELPEVETTARGLRGHLPGLRVADVGGVSWPRSLVYTDEAELRRALLGRVVLGVGRRGKLLLLFFEGGPSLAFHRRMSGNLLLCQAGSVREKHTRLVITFENGTELHFADPRKFGRVVFASSSDEMARYVEARLGPEPLENLTSTGMEDRLYKRRGRLKALLLDQRFLAGIGNLYADEILWRARLHPERPGASLTREEVDSLVEAIGTVLRAAVERRGTSLNDYRDACGELGLNQAYLEAYGRQGLPCRRCGAQIVKMWLGQRGTHICPLCQRRDQHVF